jgi:hypothetical protein
MGKYIVDCGINWGSKYSVEADTPQDAEEKAKKMFLTDYCLTDNPQVSGLGIDIDIEEAENEDE